MQWSKNSEKTAQKMQEELLHFVYIISFSGQHILVPRGNSPAQECSSHWKEASQVSEEIHQYFRALHVSFTLVSLPQRSVLLRHLETSRKKEVGQRLPLSVMQHHHHNSHGLICKRFLQLSLRTSVNLLDTVRHHPRGLCHGYWQISPQTTLAALGYQWPALPQLTPCSLHH